MATDDDDDDDDDNDDDDDGDETFRTRSAAQGESQTMHTQLVKSDTSGWP